LVLGDYGSGCCFNVSVEDALDEHAHYGAFAAIGDGRWHLGKHLSGGYPNPGNVSILCSKADYSCGGFASIRSLDVAFAG
jgi:hypothetical protein